MIGKSRFESSRGDARAVYEKEQEIIRTASRCSANWKKIAHWMAVIPGT